MFPDPYRVENFARQRRRRRHDHRRRRCARRTAPTCGSGRSSASATWWSRRTRWASPRRSTRSCRCRSAPRRCCRSTWPARSPRSPPTACGTGRTTSTGWRAPTGRCSSSTRPTRGGRRRCSRPASPARCSRRTCRAAPARGPASPNQHAAGKTGTAQNASDGWFVGLHALPRHRGVDRLAHRQRGGGDLRHRHHRRVVPGRDLGPLHAGVARGPRGGRVRGATSGRTAARATCRWTATTTPAAGAAAGRPRHASQDPSTTRHHDPARTSDDHDRGHRHHACPTDTTTTDAGGGGGDGGGTDGGDGTD